VTKYDPIDARLSLENPGRIGHFVSRENEGFKLETIVDREAPTTAIWRSSGIANRLWPYKLAILGERGVGKTTLAVRVGCSS